MTTWTPSLDPPGPSTFWLWISLPSHHPAVPQSLSPVKASVRDGRNRIVPFRAGPRLSLLQFLCIPFENVNQLLTGIPCFVVFSFTAFHRDWIFYKLEVCGNPALTKAISTIFLTALALHHILIILALFQLFHYYYGDLWLVSLMLQL